MYAPGFVSKFSIHQPVYTRSILTLSETKSPAKGVFLGGFLKHLGCPAGRTFPADGFDPLSLDPELPLGVYIPYIWCYIVYGVLYVGARMTIFYQEKNFFFASMKSRVQVCFPEGKRPDSR